MKRDKYVNKSERNNYSVTGQRVVSGEDINQVKNSYRRLRRIKGESQFSGLGLLILRIISSVSLPKFRKDN